MKYLACIILALSLSGCSIHKSAFELKKERLEQDIQILKLEVRKEKLSTQLEELEEK